MTTKQRVSFVSDGERISGVLHVPDGPRVSPTPAVILIPDFAATLAPVLVLATGRLLGCGMTVLRIDPRCTGASGGMPRGQVDPQAHVEDARSAVTFLASGGEVDPSRVALWGTGLSAGVALQAAALDERIAAVAAFAPVGDGARWLHALHTPAGRRHLLTRVQQDRLNRARGARPDYLEVIGADMLAVIPQNLPVGIDPPRATAGAPGAHETVPTRTALDPPGDATRRDSGGCDEGAAGAGGPMMVDDARLATITLRSVDFILSFCPEAFLPRLGSRPTLIVPAPAPTATDDGEAWHCWHASGGTATLITVPDRLWRDRSAADGAFPWLAARAVSWLRQAWGEREGESSPAGGAGDVDGRGTASLADLAGQSLTSIPTQPGSWSRSTPLSGKEACFAAEAETLWSRAGGKSPQPPRATTSLAAGRGNNNLGMAAGGAAASLTPGRGLPTTAVRGGGG